MFAEILTRWVRGYRNEKKELLPVRGILLQESKQILPAADDFIWPDLAEFRSSQLNAGQRPEGLTLDLAENLLKRNGCIWVPSDDLEVQLKVFVVAYCGTLDHRGQDATKST